MTTKPTEAQGSNAKGETTMPKLDDATKRLLNEARHEIRELRRANELLSAKVQVMELFACVLHTEPARAGGGMAPDVAWAIDQVLDEAS